MSNTSTKLYELAYFLTSEISEDDILAHLQKIRDLLSKHEGEIKNEELPYLRKLAYPIRHEKEGYFGYIHFNAPINEVKEINTALGLSKDVLRHIIVEVTKKQLAQKKQDLITAQRQPQTIKEDESVLKEGATSQVEENKVELKELDEKLEEILNK